MIMAFDDSTGQLLVKVDLVDFDGLLSHIVPGAYYAIVIGVREDNPTHAMLHRISEIEDSNAITFAYLSALAEWLKWCKSSAAAQRLTSLDIASLAESRPLECLED